MIFIKGILTFASSIMSASVDIDNSRIMKLNVATSFHSVIGHLTIPEKWTDSALFELAKVTTCTADVDIQTLQSVAEAADLHMADSPMGPDDLYKAVQLVAPHAVDVDIKEEVIKHLSSTNLTVSFIYSKQY